MRQGKFMTSTAIFWFRQDLRLVDNPALNAAFEQHDCIIPVYLHTPNDEGGWSAGEPSLWWLERSLKALKKALKNRHDLLLQIRKGDAFTELEKIIHESDADAVFWNRQYEPAIVKRDEKIKSKLKVIGLYAKSYNGNLLWDPWQIENKSGEPYKVFTAFHKNYLTQPQQDYRAIVSAKKPLTKGLKNNLNVSDLGLVSSHPWHKKLNGLWEPGEASAQDQLNRFITSYLVKYPEERDEPAKNATSILSIHLHFGEISVRQIFAVTQDLKLQHTNDVNLMAIEAFERQLIWREFAHHLMFHFPHTIEQVFNPKYSNFPWQDDPEIQKLWQQGETGIPLVDAGMKELWATGIMHNRARMIVASFLIKNLGQHWLTGARWFWDTLLDADLANNTMGWQWVAGSGADAAPYYRIFSPVRQGERFDPQGEYIRRWLPELSGLPDRYIYTPWMATADILADSGVKLAENYPRPIVDLADSRKAALDIYKAWKRNQTINIKKYVE